jgi:O-antigen ligase
VDILDILLLGLLGLIIIRAVVAQDSKIIRTPLDFPLLAFYAIAMLSTLNAILQSSVTFNAGLGESRQINSYLTFFLVTNLVRKDRQIRTLWSGMLVLAMIVAAAMMVQYLLGLSTPFLPGRVEMLNTEGVTYSNVSRIIPPGDSLVLVTFITITAIIALDKFKSAHILRFPLWGLLGVAMVLTFKRHYFIAVGLAVLLLAYLCRGQGRRRLIGWGVVAALVTVTATTMLGELGSKRPDLVSGVIERITSLSSLSTLQDPNSSIRWRDFEYQYALPQIVAHPLIGLGLGARYRPLVGGRDSEEFDGRGYIHNGHLYIVLKSGLLGYFFLAWLSLACLWRGFKYWRLVPNYQARAIVLGFTLTYLAVLIGSIVSPILMAANWTPVIGIMLGMNEVILGKTIRENR